MDANEYQKKALKSLNPNLNKEEVLINSVMGLCGEAGEAIDIVKKTIHQGHEFNKEKFILELGDIAWYLAEASHAVGYDLNTVLELNLNKLNKRYPDGFKTNDSIKRLDEKE